MAPRLPLYLCLLLLACTDPFEGLNLNCTASVEPAILVSLVDGVTGSQGLPGFPISEFMDRSFGSVRDGGFVDSLRSGEWTGDTLRRLGAAGERAGRYDVLVRIDGYGDWRALGVTVERGVCHVQTVELRAVLLPG